MEIQDRNNLLQILVGAKEGKTQLGFDKAAFADVLNFTKAEFVKPSGAVENVEFGRDIKKNVAFDVKGDREIFSGDKEVSKKVEEKNVTSNKSNENKSKEKEDVKEENGVAVHQEAKNTETVAKDNGNSGINLFTFYT